MLAFSLAVIGRAIAVAIATLGIVVGVWPTEAKTVIVGTAKGLGVTNPEVVAQVIWLLIVAIAALSGVWITLSAIAWWRRRYRPKTAHLAELKRECLRTAQDIWEFIGERELQMFADVVAPIGKGKTAWNKYLQGSTR